MQISSLSPNPAVGQTLHCSSELEQGGAAFHHPVEKQESSLPSVPEAALQDSLSPAQALVDSWLEVQGMMMDLPGVQSAAPSVADTQHIERDNSTNAMKLCSSQVYNYIIIFPYK